MTSSPPNVNLCAKGAWGVPSAFLAFLASAAVTSVSAAAAAAADATETALFDIDLESLTRPPLWEPSLEEYFPVQRGGEKDENGLASPVVLRSPTNEEFVYHARRGYPILVEDWGTGLPYDGWSGKDFSESFPFGYMKAEYIHDMPGFSEKDHDTRLIDGELRFNIGSFKPDKKTMWYNLSRPASKKYKDDPLKPTTGPYVWHVKDELTPKQKKIVQGKFRAPSFLQDPLNSAKMNTSFELWFSPGDGAGAGAHNDGYCESVVSLQLNGDKKWRKMLEPEMTFLHSFDEFDGGVYIAGLWQPDLGFVNRKGGAVIWPPGYIHETKTDQPPDGSCGSAITLQFDFPQPVQFFRAYLPRLSLSSEVGQCVGMAWSFYATLSVQGITPTPKSAVMQEQMETIMHALDADKDGFITVAETLTFFETPGSAIHKELKMHPKEHHGLYSKFKAEDTVAYHDMNDDMRVSRQELWDSLVQWNVVRIRMQEGLKYVNSADREGLEKFERSLDYMRRNPVTFPNKLRPELRDIFSLPTGTKLLKSLKGVHSLSDSEFFSRVREKAAKLASKQRKAEKAAKHSKGKRKEEM